jgi:hypothetical protein
MPIIYCNAQCSTWLKETLVYYMHSVCTLEIIVTTYHFVALEALAFIHYITV